MRVFLRVSTGVLIGFVSLYLTMAQEQSSEHLIETADVVVVGTLQSAWSYPWIDGWHSRGRIIAKEVLLGNFGPASS